MKIANIRLTKDLERAANRVQQKSGLSQSDILRLAIERGLPAVEKAFAEILPSVRSRKEAA